MPKVDFKRVETDAEVENIEIKDGQLIYSKSGKTFMDYGDERIPTGSGGGSEIVISEEEPTTEDWKIWINPDDPINNIGSEVVDSLDGNETNKAPSVRAVNGIIESGSNDNGSWIKFADGTLIQYGSKNCTATTSSSGGFTHYYSQNTFTLPIEFKNTEYKIFPNINSENVTLINLVYGSVKTTSTYGLNFISSSNNDTRTIQWFAIGRWK